MDDTYHLTISAKFLGTQVEFGIKNTHMYTLASLWADVYMFTCSTMPEPLESFKAKARLPWSGEYRHIQDDRDLQDIFNQFREKKIDTMKIDVALNSLATMPKLAQCPLEPENVMSLSESYVENPPPLQTSTEIVEILNDSITEFMDQPIPEDYTNQRGSSEDSEDEVYMPYKSEIAKSIDTFDNSVHDSVTFINEGNGNAVPGSSENYDDDHLSNAASFDYDLNNMVDSNSDEEEGNSRPPISKRGRPYKETEDGRVMLEVGQLFNNLQHFRQVLRDFVVQEGFELKRIKNDKKRYTTECAFDGCSWRIHASPIDDKTTFMIKTMQVRHSCQKVHKNHEATSVWVARRFKPLIEENPDIDVKFLDHEIHRIYGLVLPTYTLYKAKNRVLNVTEEDHKRSYNNLYAYGFIVRQKNPGSMALIKTLTPHLGESSSFQRFFLSFQSQKVGFMFGCRPFIELDGCHLKGKFLGVILSAVAIDANNGVFPVAICICESECNDS
ncbi:hypothetical protein Ddye_015771 [Dipteronia dyeriana]|uniref:Transposase MuDR plant domain-containing protein n=1 Tax=Dipteronia dyeriana TaxID=168575 RepID=A0AAD9U5Y1_9ROSI|nr:hypothetical protein Ddye_015771 [Dipteronia dyeriana]